MSNPATKNTQRDVEITAADLPLHCPRDGEEMWSSHPRVFLPIEESKDGTALCPYCGTRYHLKKD